MLVHFRETPYGLAMSLVETRRENGKVRHKHVASLGSIETPPSVAARIEFWRSPTLIRGTPTSKYKYRITYPTYLTDAGRGGHPQ